MEQSALSEKSRHSGWSESESKLLWETADEAQQQVDHLAGKGPDRIQQTAGKIGAEDGKIEGNRADRQHDL